MVTDIAIPDWIKRTAADERGRDAVRFREQEIAAGKAQVVLLKGRRLVDDLLATVTRDVESFSREFADDRARDIVLDVTKPAGGFVVRKPACPAVSLTVGLQLDAGAVNCHYSFTSTRGLPPREERFDLMFIGDGDEGLRMKQPHTGQVFESADALSEFLLVPVFTGRPR